MNEAPARRPIPRLASAILVLAVALTGATGSMGQANGWQAGATRPAAPIVKTAKTGAGKIVRDASGTCADGSTSCVTGVNAGNRVASNAALPDDDFPPGGSFPVAWTTSPGANAGWALASDFTNAGPYSLRSVAITDDQSAETQVAGTFTGGAVSFSYRVSSEPGFDCLQFYIDDAPQFPDNIGRGKCGAVAWTEASFSVAAGFHILKWAYAKDSSDFLGDDAAWIDTVVLPPGTVSMLLSVTDAGSGTGTVTSNPAGIDCGSTCVGYVAAGSTVTLSATGGAGTSFVGWSGDCAGTLTYCTLSMTSAKSVTASFALPEDGFPPGGLMPVGWTQPLDADAGWLVATDTANGGLYSLKSASIGNDQSAAIQVAGTYVEGDISFAFRVSSEDGFDFLEFYVDDELKGYASGEVAWAPVSVHVTAGAHTLKWVYRKDVTNGVGADAAWIDSVVLPTGQAATSTAISAHTPDPSVVGAPIAVTASVTVTPPGTGTPTGIVTVSDGSASCPIALPATGCNLIPTSVGTKTLTATYSGDANFNGSTSPGVSHTVAPAPLDVDASVTATKYDALTDGLLALRYLLGLTGTSLTTGALGSTATRTDPGAVKDYLDGMRSTLDIDGNGAVDAPTDGVLILRYLFGLRGDALTAGAFDPTGSRNTAGTIEAYLQTLLP